MRRIFSPTEQWVAIPLPQTFGTALRRLMELQIHATFACIVFHLMQAVTVASVGNYLPSDDVAGFTLAMSLSTHIGMSMLWGSARALDTLVSQAYGRDPHSAEIPTAFLRGVAVTFASMIPGFVFFAFSQKVLISFSSEAVEKIASGLLRWAVPFNVLQVFCTLIQRSLVAQRLANIVFVANCCGLAVCAAANYFLTPFGVEYAMLALALGIAVAVIVMAAGALLHPQSAFKNADWPSFAEVLAWQEVKRFAWLSLVGMVALVGERWALLALTVLAYSLPSPTLAALGICFALFPLLSPVGTALACGAMCGNSLGEGNLPLARAYLRVSVLDTIVLTLTVATCLYTLTAPVFGLFTRDALLIGLIEKCRFPLILFYSFEAFRTVAYAVSRGFGENAVTPVIVAVGLWLFGVPAAWYFSHHMSVPLEGLFFGFSMGYASEVILLVMDMQFRWDWEAIRDSATGGAEKGDASVARRDESAPLL